MLWICGLDGFLHRHRREDARHALAEHALARAGRPDEQQAVSAGGGDFDGALHMVLPAHVGEIHVVVAVAGEECGEILAQRCERIFAGEEGECLAEIAHAIHVNARDHRGLARILDRHNELLPPDAAGLDGDREHAAHGTHRAVEREFADEAKVVGVIELHVLRAGDHGECDGEIEARALFFHVGGSEVHGHVAARPAEAAVGNRGLHAVACLAHGGIWQADDDDGILLPAVIADFDFQIVGFHSEDRCGKNFCEHCAEKCQNARRAGSTKAAAWIHGSHPW